MENHSDIRETSQIFKALGDETRLKIILLLNTGELCVCDIMEVLSLPQSTASRHLAYLKNSGWVTGRRSGKWMYYTLNIQGPCSQMKQAILANAIEIDSAKSYLTQLNEYLKEKQKECK